MKKVYLFQNIKSLNIYKFDLFEYDSSKDYRDICNFVLSTQFNCDVPNEECYAFLVYIFATHSGFNKKHRQYKLVKSLIRGIFVLSWVQNVQKSFADKFRYLGSSTIVFNF